VSVAGGAHFALASYLSRERRAIDDELARLLTELLPHVPASVAEPIRYAVDAGGKRLRPVLFLATYRAAAGVEPGRGARTIACALELIHTYSLVHDDLPCMDDDDLRRGRATTHRVFGVQRATAAGAAFVPLALQAVAEGGEALGLPEELRAALVSELVRGAGALGMVGGQWLDLAAEQGEVDLGGLERIHALKTGALLVAAVRMGALAAEAPSLALAALTDYGRAVGLAFQIADDLLDVTGTAEVLGKTAGRDEALSKATFPALLGVDEARARARALVQEAHGALSAAGIDDPALVALARFAVERDR
jgi:geranylgeranyl diphosphate synthase, type II